MSSFDASLPGGSVKLVLNLYFHCFFRHQTQLSLQRQEETHYS